MGLTTGRDPFGRNPGGRFNFTPDPPTGAVLFWDPVPYRLRAFLAGEPVFDTTRAKLLHETGHLPVYYPEPVEPAAFLAGRAARDEPAAALLPAARRRAHGETRRATGARSRASSASSTSGSTSRWTASGRNGR
jgi:hypothetical protein